MSRKTDVIEAIVKALGEHNEDAEEKARAVCNSLDVNGYLDSSTPRLPVVTTEITVVMRTDEYSSRETEIMSALAQVMNSCDGMELEPDEIERIGNWFGACYGS